MDRIYLNFRNKRINGVNGIVAVLGLLLAIVVLGYVLLHNPHQKLHEAIFKTADNIRAYYRDQPNYWKLSTDLAKEAGLADEVLQKQSEYIWQIGEGANGETAMPNDGSFDIALKNLSKSACINLSELTISPSQQLGLQKITIKNDENSVEFMWGDEDHPLPILHYATRRICSPNGNTVIWTFQ